MIVHTDRPRVLVVSLGRLGGVTQYGFAMAKALAAVADVAAITSATAENREKWGSIDIPHLEVATFSGIPGMLASYLSAGRFARIRRFASEFDLDIVYYPGGHAWKPVLDLVLPRRARIVLTVHDPDLHPGEDSLLHRLFHCANRRKADGYVLLNRGQSTAFVERHSLDPVRVAVIPHGVFDDFPRRFPPLGDVDHLAHIAPHAGRYLLFIGRIRPYKGIDTLLRAYRDTPGLEDVPLVIAGSGEFSDEERALLESLAERPVEVVNRWLEPEDISALVSSARFVVLPYTSATQSGVIPLASAFGIPSIASDTGGLAEQVVDGETGLLFAVGDSVALGVALDRASQMDEADYRRMSGRAREHAETTWSWDRLARQLLEFCESLTAENG